MRTKQLKLRWIAALVGAFLPAASYADFSLTNININDFSVLINEFSANSHYSTVNSASSIGGLGSFELGVVGGITKAPDTLALVKRNDPGTSFKDILPHGAILGRVGVPYGITAELLWLPKIKAQNISLDRWGIGAQWTMTDNVLDGMGIPVAIALKGFYTKTTLKYSQTISGVPADINLTNGLWGVMALTSYKVLVFDPYIGIGYTAAKGDLTVSAATPVALLAYLPSSTSQSTGSSPTSAQFQVGTDITLAFFSLGLEYVNAFSKNSYNARVSFRF